MLENMTERNATANASQAFAEAPPPPDTPASEQFNFADPAERPPPIGEVDENRATDSEVRLLDEAGSGDDDESAFFGRTSQAHVGSPPGNDWESASYPPSSPSILLDSSSPQLRDHLFGAFIKYQPLWVEVVNMENFKAARLLEHSRWHSDFLEHAILASAARLSTSKAVRALGPHFVRLANADIYAALDDPSPASLQGFLLLSEYEVTRGQDRIGWMFCGTCYPTLNRCLLSPSHTA